MKRTILSLVATIGISSPLLANDGSITNKGPVMKWHYDYFFQVFRVNFRVQAGKNYELVRYDIKNKYYDVITNQTFTTTGRGNFFVNPIMPSDEDQPKPSGQCWFYLVVK